jgi:hypothetical protein
MTATTSPTAHDTSGTLLSPFGTLLQGTLRTPGAGTLCSGTLRNGTLLTGTLRAPRGTLRTGTLLSARGTL